MTRTRALCRGAGSRSVSRVAVGDHAAADAGGGGDRALSRFLRRFPTVEKLAAAREASVLAAWSGLGYYRRARMLHAAAKIVARERGGNSLRLRRNCGRFRESGAIPRQRSPASRSGSRSLSSTAMSSGCWSAFPENGWQGKSWEAPKSCWIASVLEISIRR